MSFAPVGSGSFPVGSDPFNVRGLPGDPNAISGIRFANESPVTLQLNWSDTIKFLYPAMADVFPTPVNPKSDVIVTPLNVYPPNAAPSGVLLAEVAVMPDTWAGAYPMSLPPGVTNVGPVTASITGNVPVLNAPGSSLATSRDQYQAGTFTAPHTAITSRNVNIDSDTHAIGLTILGSGAGPLVQVTGVQTGVAYATQTLPGNPTEFYGLVPINSAYDTQIGISVNNGDATNNLTVFVTGVRDPQVMQVTPGLATWKATIATQIQDNLGNAVSVDTISSFGNALVVSERRGSPAVWQSSPFSAVVNAALAVGATQQVITGLANQSIYLGWVTVYVDGGAGNSDFRLRNGAIDIAGAYGTPGRGLLISKDFKGRKLSLGTPFNIFLSGGAAASFVNVSADYDQF